VNVAPTSFNVLSLFSGGGGLDLGIALAVPAARVICCVEREAYAAATLAARMEDGCLDDAPIWSDVAAFDGEPWRGVVDCVAGGFPCQDISNAGDREGIDGERSGLWSEFARIIREVGPRVVFVENVAALIVRGLDRVLGDLADLGFAAEWDVFRASDVGAPHQRARLFILAHAVGAGSQGRQGERGDAREECPPSERGCGATRAIAFPPGPDDGAGWRRFLDENPGLEPAICRGADGLAHRVDRLRLLGNGVVPQQAALAWRVLDRRLRGVR
jgi:DNA (cytosine-5)-methyltransferase 1